MTIVYRGTYTYYYLGADRYSHKEVGLFHNEKDAWETTKKEAKDRETANDGCRVVDCFVQPVKVY